MGFRWIGYDTQHDYVFKLRAFEETIIRLHNLATCQSSSSDLIHRHNYERLPQLASTFTDPLCVSWGIMGLEVIGYGKANIGRCGSTRWISQKLERAALELVTVGECVEYNLSTAIATVTVAA